MIYYLTHYQSDAFPFLIKYLRNKDYEAGYLHSPTDSKEYVTNKRGIIGKTDEEIAGKIEQAYADQEEKRKKVSCMQAFLADECSAKRYCERMLSAIEAAQSHNQSQP